MKMTTGVPQKYQIQESPLVTRKKKKRFRIRINFLFLFTVLIPAILSGTYFGFIASDIYVSESRFFVRGPHTQESSSSLNQLLSHTGFSHASNDASAIQDFILSRDALQKLDQHFGLKESFSSPSIDRIRRFGGLDWDLSFEALLLYYQKRVTVTIDSTSSISTLRVEAFSPEQAQLINVMLLGMSEELVNQLNRRAREDMIQFATTEVQKAETQAKEALFALSTHRNSKGVFDPKQQSGLQLQRVSTLQSGLVEAKTQLAQILTVSPNSPSIPVLRERINSLESEIKAENARVAGAAVSLSVQTPEYERLELEIDFAGKQLTSALATLELARNTAMRQQLYLERIVQPNKPDIAIEPRRIKLFVATIVLGLLSWGVLGLLLAGVREHRS